MPLRKNEEKRRNRFENRPLQKEKMPGFPTPTNVVGGKRNRRDPTNRRKARRYKECVKGRRGVIPEKSQG